jgi:hypothetical protein
LKKLISVVLTCTLHNIVWQSKEQSQSGQQKLERCGHDEGQDAQAFGD